jgi:uncharacterized protein YukE
MSMDDQFIQMQNFHRALNSFNEHLRSSVADLESKHEQVSPHWQDEMRKHYDSLWDRFDEAMKRYVGSDGPNYVEFLTIKLQALRRYLQGG